MHAAKDVGEQRGASSEAEAKTPGRSADYRTGTWSHRVTSEYGPSMEPARQSRPPGGDGRIPFTFRIVVTGHRDLADPDALRAPIREAVRRLKEIVPVSPEEIVPVVISALAEGADRLVAEVVLRAQEDARLEVALPLPAEDYIEDFKTEDSKR